MHLTHGCRTTSSIVTQLHVIHSYFSLVHPSKRLVSDLLAEFDESFFRRGDVALIAPSDPLAADSQWTIERAFSKGHSEVVRCALWDESVSEPTLL